MYQNMIDGGVCAEQARMFLPQNMMTEWIWSGTLGAFCDMLRLRLDEHTQEETRQVALFIDAEITRLFPASSAALKGE
jgi:thymidylate synthase (FAD)